VVGAALCRWTFDRHLVERIGSGRALRITPTGERALRAHFGIEAGAAAPAHDQGVPEGAHAA
jgi:hypothetical protein